MNEFAHAFRTLTPLPSDKVDLTNLYGRIGKASPNGDFSYLENGPDRRLTWVFDHETLRHLLTLPSHFDMIIHLGLFPERIRYHLGQGKKFKMAVFQANHDEVKLATWSNILQLLSEVYPEIDPRIWTTYEEALKEKTFDEIDEEKTIVKHYLLGRGSTEYMDTKKFMAIEGMPTLTQVRAFLFHELGFNELFGGKGHMVTHEGVSVGREYLTKNRMLTELGEHLLLDLNPVVP